MGWYYTNDGSRADVIAELTEDNSKEGKVYRTLRKCFRGNVMYALHETGPIGETKKWIGVYLLQKGTRDYPGWGYKPMDETMEPYYYDCPVSYLDAADEPMGDGAKRWREVVREKAARRASIKPKAGESWRLRSGKEVRIKSVRPLHGWIGGTLYRIKRTNLVEKLKSPGMTAA